MQIQYSLLQFPTLHMGVAHGYTIYYSTLFSKPLEDIGIYFY